MKNAKLAALVALIPALGLVAYFGAVVPEGERVDGAAALDEGGSARRVALGSGGRGERETSALASGKGSGAGDGAQTGSAKGGAKADGAGPNKGGAGSGLKGRRRATAGGRSGQGSARSGKASAGDKRSKRDTNQAPGRGYAGSARQVFAGGEGAAAKVGDITSDPSIDEARDDPQDSEEDRDDEDRPQLGETVTTLVAGKIMTETRREGLPGATVHLLVFHPLTTAQNAPTWTIVTSLQADGQGLFTASLELPAIAPAGAPLAVVASHPDHVPAGAVPVLGVTPGHDASLGVFWLGARSQRLEGTVTPSELAIGSGLVDTGGLNPLAWDSRQRDALLSLFPARPLSGGTFQLDIAPRGPGVRNVSLVREGRWLGSTTVEWGLSEPAGEAGQSGAGSQSGPGPQSSSEAGIEIGRCAFVLGPETGLGGRVIRVGGGGLGGTTVTALGADGTALGVAATDVSGAFRFPRAPVGLQRFRVEHSEFLTREVVHDPLAGDPTLVLTDPRPDIPLQVLDPSGQPVTVVRITAFGAPVTTGAGSQDLIKTPPGETPTQLLALTSPTGEYGVTAPFRIESLTIAAEGWFPNTLASVENRPSAAIPVRLEAARVVHQTARQAVARSGANNSPSHGIYWWDHLESSLLAWSQENWLEFECDFGADATPYDFELGVRNHRIVDNLYRFAVRVELDGMDPQTLSIAASETETRTGRLSLPARSGLQRVRITWLNDRWIPGQLDANIIVDWVKFHQRAPDAATPGAPTPAGG